MIKIDIDTRCWQIPKEEAFLGVESDDKVKILQFELSKNEFCDGLNFTDCNCFINYKNEGNDTIPYLITDMEVQVDGTVTFTWQVSRGATIFKGNTFAVLCAKKVRNDGTITNEWNSRIGSFTVAKGIEPLSSIAEVPEIDIISQLLLVAKQTNENAQTNINQSSSLLEKAEGLGYLKEDFDVLEARMNQFTSLKEGSTTGDAELIDGRIGYDGTVYDNIGGAIRGQVSELKGDLSKLDECIIQFRNLVDEVIVGKYAYFGGGIGQSVTILDNAEYSYVKVKVKPNTYYSVSKIYRSNSFSGITDEGGIILGQILSYEDKSYSGFIIRTPENAKYMYLSYNTTENDCVVLETTKNILSQSVTSYPFGKLLKVFIPKLDLGNVVIIGKESHCDFNEIQSAFDAITDDSENNPYTFIILRGKYERFSEKTRARYISLVGLDRDNTIVQSDTGYYESPAADIWINGVIKNLSFKNIAHAETWNREETQRDIAYAVHMDFGTQNIRFENCYFETNAGASVGVGLWDNETLTFDNCEFVSNGDGSFGKIDQGALYIHTSYVSGATNQNLIIKNCIMDNKFGDPGFYFSKLASVDSSYNTTFQNNAVFSLSNKVWLINPNKTKYCYGNIPSTMDY